VIIVDDPKDNIWEKNPHLEIITEFKDFKKQVGFRKSSKVLTALFLIYDPKSPLRNQGWTEEEILEDVNKNYLTYKNFDWDDYEDIKEVYLNKTISKIEKLFIQYEKDLEDLNLVMRSWKYDKNNVKERSALIKEYKTLLADYMELRSKVEEQKKTIQNRAGYKESLAEKLGKA
jgi:uncharacterized protein YihD (DUF1040 family)